MLSYMIRKPHAEIFGCHCWTRFPWTGTPFWALPLTHLPMEALWGLPLHATVCHLVMMSWQQVMLMFLSKCRRSLHRQEAKSSEYHKPTLSVWKWFCSIQDPNLWQDSSWERIWHHSLVSLPIKAVFCLHLFTFPFLLFYPLPSHYICSWKGCKELDKADAISEEKDCILHEAAVCRCLKSAHCVHSTTINYRDNDSGIYMALRNETGHIVLWNASAPKI